MVSVAFNGQRFKAAQAVGTGTKYGNAEALAFPGGRATEISLCAHVALTDTDLALSSACINR
jgi:hypothetical protein